MEYVSADPDAAIYHHPAWLRSLRAAYGINPKAFCSIEDEKIRTGFPFVLSKPGGRGTSAVSISGTGSGLSVVGNGDVNELLEHFAAYLKTNSVTRAELRDNLFSKDFNRQFMGYSHHLNLEPDVETVKRLFRTTAIERNIRKAEREGLEYRTCSDYRAVEQFYALNLETKRKLGLFCQPMRFFKAYWEEIIQTGMGFAVIVGRENRIMSAGLFGGFHKTLSYIFGASSPSFLRLRPNNLMLWGAIQEAKRQGYGIFHMGRTEAGNEGLRAFKLNWGCNEAPLYFSYYPSVPKANVLGSVHKRIVAPVLRRSPTLLSRAVGEMVFRLFPLRFL